MAELPTQTYDVGDLVTLSCIVLTGATLGTIFTRQATLTVQDASGFAQGDPIFVVRAGAVGGDLTTSIASIDGDILSLHDPAGTSATLTRVGKLQSPTTVECLVREPNGNIGTVVNSGSQGKFTANFAVTQSGDHFVRWIGAGAAVGAQERQFFVQEERVQG